MSFLFLALILKVCGQRVGEAQKRVFGVDLLQQLV